MASNASLSSVDSVPSVATRMSGEKTLGETQKKRKEIERLREELKRHEEEFKALKMKYAAATSRAASLEKEAMGLRASESGKMKVVAEKSENDDRLIEALKGEIAKYKKPAVASVSASMDVRLLMSNRR